MSVEEKRWFAMWTFARQEIPTRNALLGENVQAYVPTRTRKVKRPPFVRLQTVEEPVVTRLIFVHETLERLGSLKMKYPALHFCTAPKEGRNLPLIVPDNQMEAFIRFIGSAGEKVEYVQGADESLLVKGTRVRVVSGPLAGCEGVIISRKSSRKAHFVVSLENFVSARVEFTDGEFEVLPI